MEFISNYYVEFIVEDQNKLASMERFITDFQQEKNVQNEATTDDIKWLSYFDQGIEFSWLLDILYNGEYELVSVKTINETIGRLEYKPWAWPYGGPEALQWLVQMFGFQIVKAVENDMELKIQQNLSNH